MADERLAAQDAKDPDITAADLQAKIDADEVLYGEERYSRGKGETEYAVSREYVFDIEGTLRRVTYDVAAGERDAAPDTLKAATVAANVAEKLGRP